MFATNRQSTSFFVSNTVEILLERERERERGECSQLEDEILLEAGGARAEKLNTARPHAGE